MEKFTKWSTEHDAQMAKRQGANKKARLDRSVPIVKKVAEVAEVAAPVAEVADVIEEAPAATQEETKTEE
jgi:hypothetical protein